MNASFEPLSAEKILNAIDSRNRPELTELEIFESIASTNQYLLDQAKIGSSKRVCLAEHQTAGRGRHGRTWFSVSGSSILCSLLWRFPISSLAIPSVGIAVGVMIVRALKKYGVQTGIQLKWPNDILYANRKLAGILIERRNADAVIGVGLNVKLPRPLEPNYIDLAEITNQPNIDRNYLSGLLLNELFENLPHFQTNGLVPYLDEWNLHDCLAGHDVDLYTPEKTIKGIAQGINEQGELLLLDETQKLQHYCYGEVSVRYPLAAF